MRSATEPNYKSFEAHGEHFAAKIFTKILNQEVKKPKIRLKNH